MKIYFNNSSKYSVIDKEDYEKVADRIWLLRKAHASLEYAYCNQKGDKVFMHRLIAETPKGLVTDHINRNGLDNRKKNLRVCSYRENAWNRNTQYNNTSGCRGVTLFKRTNRWRASIQYEGKRIHLGFYTTFKEAADVYKKASKLYFKEFSPF